MNNQKKTAIVVGAGDGVGRAATLTLAKEGYNLVVVGRSVGNTEESAELARSLGADAIAVQADVGSEEDTLRYINAAIQTYGGIDVFVNSAARYQPNVMIHETDTAVYNDVIRTNLNGTFLSMKYVLQQMVKQKSGIIVNVGSRNGLFSEPLSGAYTASKHGMIGLTKTAAREYGPMGIRVCAVCPGAINTKMIAENLKEIDFKLLGPMERPAEAQEIADVVCYLASEKASYMNGSIVRVDGGLGV